jgi:hypothetical protein
VAGGSNGGVNGVNVIEGGARLRGGLRRGAARGAVGGVGGAAELGRAGGEG